MSGYSCPDCGCQHLGGTDRETDGRPVLHCHICEWEGTFEGGWREELTIDGYEECSRKYKLRKEGRLFFVRIHFIDKDQDMVVFRKARDILGITTWIVTQGGYALISFNERPTEDTVERLKATPQVSKVTVS